MVTSERDGVKQPVRYYKERQKRWSWVPGAPEISVELSEEQYHALIEARWAREKQQSQGAAQK